MGYNIENVINRSCTHYTVMNGNAAPEFLIDDVLFLKKTTLLECVYDNKYLFVFEDNVPRICTTTYENTEDGEIPVLKMANEEGVKIYVHEEMILGVYQIIAKADYETSIKLRHSCLPLAPFDFLSHPEIHHSNVYLKNLPIMQAGFKLFPKKPFTSHVLQDIYLRMLNMPVLFMKRVMKYYERAMSDPEYLLKGDISRLSNSPEWIINVTVAELAYADLAIFQRYLRRVYRINPRLIYRLYYPYRPESEIKRNH
jgi:hypothetical protein